MIPAAIGIGQEHVRCVVDNAAIDFFRNAVIKAAIARLHMIDRNAAPLGALSGQGRIGIAQHKKALGTFFDQQRIRLRQNIADLRPGAVRPGMQAVVWRTHLQLLKKLAGKAGVIILPGKDQHMFAERIQQGDNPRQTDNFRSGAQYRHNFHASISSSTPLRSSPGMSLYFCSRATVSS